MEMQAKICGILYDCSGKPGSNYPDLEQGKEFWNRIWVPGSDYKSLDLTMFAGCRYSVSTQYYFATCCVLLMWILITVH